MNGRQALQTPVRSSRRTRASVLGRAGLQRLAVSGPERSAGIRRVASRIAQHEQWGSIARVFGGEAVGNQEPDHFGGQSARAMCRRTACGVAQGRTNKGRSRAADFVPTHGLPGIRQPHEVHRGIACHERMEERDDFGFGPGSDPTGRGDRSAAGSRGKNKTPSPESGGDHSRKWSGYPEKHSRKWSVAFDTTPESGEGCEAQKGCKANTGAGFSLISTFGPLSKPHSRKWSPKYLMPSLYGIRHLYCIGCLQRTERSTWPRLGASDLDLTFGRSSFQGQRGAFA